MKKVSRENLDALFAAIAEAKKLYLPVADSTMKSAVQSTTVWTPKTKYASELSIQFAAQRTFSSRR